MSNLKPELSKKSKYWIERNRYFELKYFSLQYPYWVEMYKSLDGITALTFGENISSKNSISDPVPTLADKRMYYMNRILLIEKTAKETDIDLYSYLLKGVTEGVTYTYLKTRLNIPCCRESYYNLYRRFFWILNTSQILQFVL